MGDRRQAVCNRWLELHIDEVITDFKRWRAFDKGGEDDLFPFAITSGLNEMIAPETAQAPMTYGNEPTKTHICETAATWGVHHVLCVTIRMRCLACLGINHGALSAGIASRPDSFDNRMKRE